MEESQTRHWYDTEAHRIACGAPGQSGSTKHASAVTCSACLALLAEARDAARADSGPRPVSTVP